MASHELVRICLLGLALIAAVKSEKSSLACSSEEVAKFCNGHDWMSVTIVETLKGNRSEVATLMRALAKRSIAINVQWLQNFKSSEDSLVEGNHILMAPSSLRSWWDDQDGMDMWKLVQKFRTGSTIIVQSGFNARALTPPTKANALFFILDSDECEWYKVLTMNNSPSVNAKRVDLSEINGKSALKLTDHDLTNISIATQGIEFEEQTHYEDCNLTSYICSSVKGASWQTMQLFQTLFNAQLIAYKEPNDQFGVFLHPNSTDPLTGVFGAVVQGHKDMGINFWGMTPERVGVVDVVVFYYFPLVLAFVKDNGDQDYGYLLRPFQPTVYLTTILLMLTVIVILTVARKLNSYSRQCQHRKVATIVTLANILFVVLNAAYGGALTMVAVDQAALPFHNLREALLLYPQWQIVVKPGDETVFKFMINQEDIEDELRTEILSSVKGVAVSENEVAMSVFNSKTAFLTFEDQIHLFVDNLDWPTDTLQIVSAGNKLKRQVGMLITYNSPLQPYIEWLAVYMREHGMSQKIFLKLPKHQNWHPNEPVRPVTLGQVIVAVILAGLGILVSTFVLLVECCAHHLNRTKQAMELRILLKNPK